MGGTGKGLLKGYVLLSLFLRTVSNFSARIPLPPSLRTGGTEFRCAIATGNRESKSLRYSPGEGLLECIHLR